MIVATLEDALKLFSCNEYKQMLKAVRTRLVLKERVLFYAVRQHLIKMCKFCHNTVMVEFTSVALHQRHTNYPPEGYCWKERPSGYFSTSHNTSLFLSTHRGHIPLFLPLTPLPSIASAEEVSHYHLEV